MAPAVARALNGANGLLYGGPLPGMLSRELALQVPAVRRGVNLIAGSVGSFPLARWRGEDRMEPGRFLAYPEDYRPYARTMAATVRHLVLYPYAWWQVTNRTFSGFPDRVRVLDPEYVSFDREFGTDEVSAEYAFYKGRKIPRADLICFEGPDDGLLAYGRLEILTALALEVAANRYASPEVPTGYLKQEGQYVLERTEIDKLLDDWEKSRMAHATAYLNAGVSYHSAQSSAADLQLVEAREESAKQLARLLGIPARYMSVHSGDSMTYSNVAAERSDFVDLCLSPYMEAITGRLSMEDRNGSPRGQNVAFDLDNFLRGDPAERAQRSKTLVDLDVMDRAEARRLERLPGPPPKRSAPPSAPAAPTGQPADDPPARQEAA
ncbi:phage portal protein [Catenulispora rubra]|uniref:phage portal protein n=1 Tax=Catenulispora rubra TaxID=280293 RepID=UPI001892560D|nr:phage portal protein [Catenulispora rubra]